MLVSLSSLTIAVLKKNALYVHRVAALRTFSKIIILWKLYWFKKNRKHEQKQRSTLARKYTSHDKVIVCRKIDQKLHNIFFVLCFDKTHVDFEFPKGIFQKNNLRNLTHTENRERFWWGGWRLHGELFGIDFCLYSRRLPLFEPDIYEKWGIAMVDEGIESANLWVPEG